MRQLPIRSLAGSCLLLFGVTVQARPKQYEDYNRIADQTAANLFHQVQVDLDRAKQETPFYAQSGDTERFERAQAELGILQREWDEGYYRQRQSKDLIAGK